MSKLIKHYIIFNAVCLLVLFLSVSFIFFTSPSLAALTGLSGAPSSSATISPGASALKQFGGRITYAAPCIPTPPDGICKNCTLCSALGGPYICAAYMEVQFTPFLGNQMIPPIVCPLIGHPYMSVLQIPTVGGQIAGFGMSPLGYMIYAAALSQ